MGVCRRVLEQRVGSHPAGCSLFLSVCVVSSLLRGQLPTEESLDQPFDHMVLLGEHCS